jgi:hypothetical protein
MGKKRRAAAAWIAAAAICCCESARADDWPTVYQKCVVVFAIVGGALLYILAIAAIFAGMLSIGTFAAAVRPARFSRTVETMENGPFRCVFLGLAAMIAAAIILAAVGRIPALALLCLFILALSAWYSLTVAAMAIGRWVLFAINSPKSDLPVWNIAVGGSLLCACAILPFIGWAVVALAVAGGLGGMLASPFSGRRAVPSPPAPPCLDSPPNLGKAASGSAVNSENRQTGGSTPPSSEDDRRQ